MAQSGVGWLRLEVAWEQHGRGKWEAAEPTVTTKQGEGRSRRWESPLPGHSPSNPLLPHITSERSLDPSSCYLNLHMSHELKKKNRYQVVSFKGVDENNICVHRVLVVIREKRKVQVLALKKLSV